MKIIEYRVFMPLTVAENQIGQLWTFAEISRINTSGGEGVKILHTKEFEVPFDKDNRISVRSLPDYDHPEASGKHTNKPSKNKKSNKLAKENNVPKTNKKAEEIEADVDENDEDVEDIEISNTKDDTSSKNGLYTKKDYYMASKFPWYIRKILPVNLATIHERSWNMYPTVKTILTNDYFTNNFRIQLDTVTRPAQLGGICDENAHNLTAEQLAKREIVVVDIAESVAPSDYKESEDPLLFKSVKSGRGPLEPGWINTHQPLVCVHKLATIEFKVFGLQTKVENYMKNMYTQMFRTFHRQVFCFMDSWYGLSLSNIREIEENLAKLLLKKIEEGEIAKCALLESE